MPLTPQPHSELAPIKSHLLTARHLIQDAAVRAMRAGDDGLALRLHHIEARLDRELDHINRQLMPEGI
jgi:hypothetical protein